MPVEWSEFEPVDAPKSDVPWGDFEAVEPPVKRNKLGESKEDLAWQLRNARAEGKLGNFATDAITGLQNTAEVGADPIGSFSRLVSPVFNKLAGQTVASDYNEVPMQGVLETPLMMTEDALQLPRGYLTEDQSPVKGITDSIENTATGLTNRKALPVMPLFGPEAGVVAPVASTVGKVLLGGEMAHGTTEAARNFGNVIADPNATTADKANALTGAATAFGMTGATAGHALPKVSDVPIPDFSGRDLPIPEGFRVPEPPPAPKAARAAVPETPAEAQRNLSVIQEIKAEELFTRKDVQDHFRKTGARVPSNEEASDLLAQAWSRPAPEEPAEPTQPFVPPDQTPGQALAADIQKRTEFQQQNDAQRARTQAEQQDESRNSEAERRIMIRHLADAQRGLDDALQNGSRKQIEQAQQRVMDIHQALYAAKQPAKVAIQPKPPLPNLPRNTFAPEVPETPAEPQKGMTVLQEIRNAGAKTKEDIRKLYPQLNREQAAQLRNQAWGEPAAPIVPPEAPAAAAPIEPEPVTPPPATNEQLASEAKQGKFAVTPEAESLIQDILGQSSRDSRDVEATKAPEPAISDQITQAIPAEPSGPEVNLVGAAKGKLTDADIISEHGDFFQSNPVGAKVNFQWPEGGNATGEVTGHSRKGALQLKVSGKSDPVFVRESQLLPEREWITPSEDTPIGVNDAGDKLYQRSNGSVYRMRNDRPTDRPHGYPDFGGDLAPKEPSSVAEPAAPEAPAAPVAPRPKRRDSIFDRETDIVGPDILSWINENGLLLSKSAARKLWGKEKFTKNKSQWDDAVTMQKPHHGMAIYGNKFASSPNQIADTAFKAGLIDEPSVNKLWEAIDAASRKRAGAFKGQERENAALAAEITEHDNWNKAIKEGGKEVNSDDLGLGDTLKLGEHEVKVTHIDPDSGDVTVDGGKQFGTKVIPQGETIKVDKITTKPFGEDFTGAEPVAEDEAPKLRPGEKGTGDLLQGEDAPFNLSGETEVDASRVAAEKAKAEQTKREAAELQAKQQPGLFDSPAISKAEQWANDKLKGGGTSSGPDVLAAYAVKGAITIARGIKDFGEWSVDMIRQLGDAVKPHLQHIWEQVAVYPGGTIKLFHGGNGKLESNRPRFFTTRAEDAQWFANERGGETPSVVEAKVTINKPARTADVEAAAKAVGATTEDIKTHSGYDGSNSLDYAYVPKVVAELKRKGFDGIIDYDLLESGEIIAAIPFDKEQVKVSGGTNEAVRKFTDDILNPDLTINNNHSNAAGLGVKSIADLDALAAVRDKLNSTKDELFKAAENDPSKQNQAFSMGMRMQYPREAVEVATNIGGWVEGGGSLKTKLGPRPLDWHNNPEVQAWLRKNADRLKISLPEDFPKEPGSAGLGKNVRNVSGATGEGGFLGVDMAKLAKKFKEGKDATVDFTKQVTKETMGGKKMNDLRKSVLDWSAKLQRSFGEASAMQKDLLEKVPDQKARQGIVNWIQADGDTRVLTQRLAATADPKLAAGYRAALALTPEQIRVANQVKSQYADTGRKANHYDLLQTFKDNYITQLWDLKKGPTGGSSSRTLRDKFRFAKASTFPTYFDGEQAGFTPKGDKDIAKILPVYMHEMNTVIAARQLVEQLWKGKASDGRPLLAPVGVGMPVENASGHATLIMPKAMKEKTSDYKVIPNQPALSAWRFAATDSDGRPVMLKADLAVHPEAVGRLKAILGRSAIREWYDTPTSATAAIPKAIAKGLDQFQSTTKRTMLGLISPFHQVQEGTHAVGHRVNPFFGIPKIDLVNNRVQMDAARHGLMLLPDRASEGQFMEGLRPSGLVSRIPGIGPVADHYSNYLFHEYIPGLKFKTYSAILDRNNGVYAKDLRSGSVTPSDIKVLSAEQTNAAFGHLNYADLARNPTIQHLLQLGLLAPDFLEARARFTGQGIKGLLGGKAGREQILALGTLAVAQATLAYTSAQLTGGQWDKTDPFSFKLGNRRYTMRSVPEDIASAMKDSRGFIYSRINPITMKGPVQALTGTDYRGKKVSLGDTAKELAQTPIPISVKGFLGIGNTSVKAWESLAGAVGLKISRDTTSNDVHKMALDWMSKSSSPKVMQAYKDQQQRSLPESIYKPLKMSVEVGDNAKIVQSVKDLLAVEPDQKARDKRKKEILREFNPFTKSPDSYDVKIKPFATRDKVFESAFIKSLDADGKESYRQSVRDQVKAYRTLTQALYNKASDPKDTPEAYRTKRE